MITTAKHDLYRSIRLDAPAVMASRLQTAVGSAAWIAAEKENITQLLEQEKEDIIYPAQHEMEWLNEHMAEIFNRNQL